MRYQWAAVAIVACIAGGAAGDTVWLKSGPRVTGKVVSAEGAAVVEIETSDGLRRFNSSMVERIEKQSQAQTQPGDDGSETTTNSSGQKNPLELLDPRPPVTTRPQDPPGPPASFTEAMYRAARITVAADGLAMWEAFAKANPDCPQADQVKSQIALWKQRVADKLAGFGPQWLPEAEVQAKSRKVELIAQAEAAGSPEAAIFLLDRAADIHPFRLDIPIRKGRICLQAGKHVLFVSAMNQAIKLDDTNATARNNLAVLCAKEKKWDQAMANFVKADVLLNPDPLLDNMDLTIELARKASVADPTVGGYEKLFRQKIEALRSAGRFVGKNRWGTEWIDEDDFRLRVRDDAAIDKKLKPLADKLADLRSQMDAAEKSRKENEAIAGETSSLSKRHKDADARVMSLDLQISNLDRSIAKLQPEADLLADRKNKITHASSLVFMRADGAPESQAGEETPLGGCS